MLLALRGLAERKTKEKGKLCCQNLGAELACPSWRGPESCPQGLAQPHAKPNEVEEALGHAATSARAARRLQDTARHLLAASR